MTAQDLDGRLELSVPEAVRGEVLTYRIINTGSARLTCGAGHVLERNAGDAWVVMNPRMAFPAIGLIVEPRQGRQLTARIPADSPSGQYLISTLVSGEPSGSPRLELSALFHVL